MSKQNKLKADILEELLDHTAFDGWTDHALTQAVKNLGHDSEMAYITFPNGISDAVNYFEESTNTQLLTKLKRKKLDKIRIRERIIFAIMTRLELHRSHKESIRSLAAYYALPYHTVQATRNLASLVDQVWYAAGDTSTDFNYYTKRMLLAGVWTSTVLYWLGDTSTNHEKTAAFLDRRIENVMQIQKTHGKLEVCLEKLFIPKKPSAI